MDVDYSHAKSALLHVTSGPSVSIGTVYDVVDGITSQFSDDAHIIFGVRNDEREYNGLIKVITIITGAKSSGLLSPHDSYLEGGAETLDEIIPSIT